MRDDLLCLSTIIALSRALFVRSSPPPHRSSSSLGPLTEHTHAHLHALAHLLCSFGSVRFGSVRSCVCACGWLLVRHLVGSLARSPSPAPVPSRLLFFSYRLPHAPACSVVRNMGDSQLSFATHMLVSTRGLQGIVAMARCRDRGSCVRAARWLVLIAAALVWPTGWSRDPLQTNRGGSQVDAGVWQLLQESVAGRDRVLARTLQGRAGRLQEEGEEHHGREGVRCSLPLSTRASSPASECHTRQRASSHAFDARAGVRELICKGR